jgi:hypothetical protein
LLTRTLAILVELRVIECDEEANRTAFIHWLERQYDKESDYPEHTRSRKEASRSRGVTRGHAESHPIRRYRDRSRDRI